MKVNLKTHKWIKAPFNKGYVLVSKEYLKQFKKKREPQTSLLEDLEDLVGQLQSDKITEDQVVEILSNIVKYEKEKKCLTLTGTTLESL